MKTIITSPNFDNIGKEVSKDLNIKKADVKMESFSDNWPNIQIVKEDVKDKIATVLLDFSDSKDFFINYATLQGLIDYKVDGLNIIMPYFPVGTMERVGKPGEVATAHTFANIISNLPVGKSGMKNNLHVFDLHAEVEEFLFDSKTVNVETHSAFSLLKEIIEGKTVVFPDEGAAKRFGYKFEGYDQIICSKERIGDQRVINLKEGDPIGKDLIIVDDLIQTGGTIIKTAKKLKEEGAKSVEAFATHGVFPNDSHIELAKNLDRLIVTDTIPANNKRSEDIDNMEVLSIDKIIKKII